ncbi:MAG: M23 family metallopeptidase [candidate division Zixibacteria bacterium]|nr:M23 family metallopeptidase [candidate division Zixibacteria bacterium]
MLKKKLSFMIITGSRDKLRQFQISYRLILGCALIVAFLFIANVLLTTSFVKSQVSAIQIKKLRAENELLTKKFEQLHGQVSEIASIYDGLVQKEITIRNIFNLPEISIDERQLGIGGPENQANPTISRAVRLVNNSETQVEALLRLAQFEKEKYEEVYGSLAEKKSLLDHTPSIMPTFGYQSRGFGIKYDPFTGNQRFHGGIDIANRTGTPVYATADGIITSASYSNGGLGNMVTIDHGYGFETIYGHLSKIKAMPRQNIKRGMLIGYIGSTGYSTGPHLHYEVVKNNREVNPLQYVVSIR